MPAVHIINCSNSNSILHNIAQMQSPYLLTPLQSFHQYMLGAKISIDGFDFL